MKGKESVPAFTGASQFSGPFLEIIPGKATTLPRLILTKTHCGGYSTSLWIIETPRTFLNSCLSGQRGVYNSSDSKTIDIHPVRYKQNLVKRVVHIIRNPLDNIVARFNYERGRYARMNDEEWLNEFPHGKQGFQVSQCLPLPSTIVFLIRYLRISAFPLKKKWCESIDNDTPAKSYWIDTPLINAFAGVPCRAEFFRYIQWHNLAFASTFVDLDVPALVFHYEDYSTRFADVIQGLLDFLELKPVADAPDFISNKTYGNYYSQEQTNAIATFVKEFSAKLTWQHMARYFEEDAAT